MAYELRISDWGSDVCSSVLPARLLVRLVELEDALGEFGRLVAVEQGLAFLEIADRVRRRIEAQRQFLRVGAQPREHVRIAADIGRDVEILLGDRALAVDEHVDASIGRASWREGVCQDG